MSVTVSVTLTNDEYKKALKDAEAKGLTISQYVKRFSIGSNEFDTRFEFLKKAAQEQNVGKRFTVMSLFEDWNEIEKGVRLTLGRAFFNLVKKGDLEGVEDAGKGVSNIQLYRRIESNNK